MLGRSDLAMEASSHTLTLSRAIQTAQTAQFVAVFGNPDRLSGVEGVVPTG